MDREDTFGAVVLARRLVLVYAALLLLLNAVVLLPGDNLSYSSDWGVVGSIAIQGLIAWGLWRGSSLAWIFGFALSALSALAIFLIGSPYDASTLAVLVICIVQASVLLLPPLTRFVWVASGSPATSR